MATSGDTTFSVTETDIIHDAAKLIRVIEAGESLSSDDYSDFRRVLNMLVKMFAVKANLWVTTNVDHTLTPGTESYTVGPSLNIDTPKPMRLIYAMRTDDNDIPMDVVSRDEYMSLPTKSTQSAALKVYFDRQLANGVLYVWPTGDTNNTEITLTFKRPIEDFDAQGNNPDLPQEWYLPLVYNLAVKAAPMFGGTIPQDIKMEAEQMLYDIESFDEEDVSMEFYPSCR